MNQIVHNPIIRYTLITERSPYPDNLLLPPLCNTSMPIFPYLGRYPKNLDCFAIGGDYYTSSLLHGLRIGYTFNVCYLDSFLNNPLEAVYDGIDTIQLLFISLSDKKNIQSLYDVLSKNHHDSIYYQCINMDWSEKLAKLPNFIVSHFDFSLALFNKIDQYIPLDILNRNETFSVPKDASSFDKGGFFSPTQVNTFTIQGNIFGNYGGVLVDDNMTAEESLERATAEREDAQAFKDEFKRQQEFVEQIQQIDFITGTMKKENSDSQVSSADNIYTPLIIAAPFNSPTLNAFFKKKIVGNDALNETIKVYKILLNSEQSKNYTHVIEADGIDSAILMQNLPLGMSLSKRRLSFLDNTAFLHASITNSPYIRLPIIGKSIYNELSFISPKAGRQLIRGGDVTKIKKKIKDIGNIIPSKTMSPEFLEHLKIRDSQIVAITDMPIEWTNIDGIPLCFSHDVCRIPETPLGGVMSHYMYDSFTYFDIPTNILEKTLVVFGCTDGKFSQWQQRAVELKQALGFEICICTSVKQFVKQIKDKSPQFLIIDSHGDTDIDKNESYVMLGDEKLTPSDIVDNDIYVPLVFLSACNTAPTYGSINILANAFFQNGSISVTSSYLPLQINTSSVLYLRLLTQLAQCSKKCIHKNWLAFVSHIFRTSMIMSPYTSAWLDEKSLQNTRQKEEVERMSRSMFFSERRKIYDLMKVGFDANGKHYDIDSILPEYMFYSNLGRSDLIYFDSWKKEQEKKVMNKIENQKDGS